LKPASVLAWTFCCHCSQRRSMLQWYNQNTGS
jgi:hypothetical protein